MTSSNKPHYNNKPYYYTSVSYDSHTKRTHISCTNGREGSVVRKVVGTKIIFEAMRYYGSTKPKSFELDTKNMQFCINETPMWHAAVEWVVNTSRMSILDPKKYKPVERDPRDFT